MEIVCDLVDDQGYQGREKRQRYCATHFGSERLSGEKLGSLGSIGGKEEDITGCPCLRLGQGAIGTQSEVLVATGHRRKTIYRVLKILKPGICPIERCLVGSLAEDLEGG